MVAACVLIHVCDPPLTRQLGQSSKLPYVNMTAFAWFQMTALHGFSIDCIKGSREAQAPLRRHEFTARTHAWIRLLTNDKVWRKSGSLERTTPPQVAPVFQKSYDYCLEGPRGGATSKDRGGGQAGETLEGRRVDRLEVHELLDGALL